MYLYPYDLLVPIFLCVGFEINYTWKTGAVCFPEFALKIKLSDQIDQISPPPFLKHILTPQNDFVIKSLGKFESVPYIARCENRSLDKFDWVRKEWVWNEIRTTNALKEVLQLLLGEYVVKVWQRGQYERVVEVLRCGGGEWGSARVYLRRWQLEVEQSSANIALATPWCQRSLL